MSLGLKVAATGQPFISIGIDQHALLPRQAGVGQKQSFESTTKGGRFIVYPEL